MDLPPPPTPQRRNTIPMDDNKMDVALSWIEKCIAIISTLSYSNVAAALMLLRLIRPTASFFTVLAVDFSRLAVVILRIVARYAEIAAGFLESVNEKHLRRDPTSCSLNDDNDNDDEFPTFDNYSKVDTGKQPSTPPLRNHESSLPSEMNRKVTSDSNVNVSVQKKQKKKTKPDTKKALGRAKILQLREKRLKMGLKVANKADAC
ncbi:hypothetical protein ACHAWT_004826 [Skeletonema menzelii]